MDYREKSLLLVVFGITGDLSQRKLLPALYHLYAKKQLPPKFRIIGLSRKKTTAESVYEHMIPFLKDRDIDHETLKELERNTEMVQLDTSVEDDYIALQKHLHSIAIEMGGPVSRLYYLSIPAQVFKEVVTHLGVSGHDKPFPEDGDQPRLLVEKPFGYDEPSAKELVQIINQNFGEQQTFRIDHYLAKETAQNILTFRFQNPLFQSVWNARHIESITISAHETMGIEGRVEFYEHTGALRDILQSHLLQLLALITMEAPEVLESTQIHRMKLRLLESVEPIDNAHVHEKATRGQYDTYRHEVNNPHSVVETYARIHLKIDNEQWRGTHITLETGKAMAEKYTEVVVQFRKNEMSAGTNALIFRLQPREGITVLLQAKQPGMHGDTDTVEMDFDYEKSFGGTSEAYERVVIDAIRGDQSLFASAEEVMASWKIVGNVLDVWSKNDEKLIIYETGTHANDI